MLIYSRLCCQEEKCAMNGEAKQALLGCIRATFTLQYSLYCLTKEPLFHTNSGSVGVEKRLFLYIMGATSQQNTIKTANRNSIINFYFVTAFYSLYDICMADKKTFFRQEDMKTCFLGKKAYAESLPPLSCANFVKRTASRVHPIHNFAKFV